MARTEVIARSTHSESLPEVLERVLDKGLVIAGDIKIKLCDIELLSIQIRLLVCSVDKAKELGMTWWWQEAPPARGQCSSSPRRPAAAPAPAAERRHALAAIRRVPAGQAEWGGVEE